MNELLKIKETGEVLHEAVNVCERRVINDMSALEFDYPVNGKGRKIKENTVIICNGRQYEVVRITRKTDGTDILHAVCEDFFSRRAKHAFIPNIPDKMGIKVTAMIDYVLGLVSEDGFNRLDDPELSALDMTTVADNSLRMDFFSVDKTNLWDFLQTVIENIGRGEIYSDGYDFAIVERIGKDKGVRLSLDHNMQSLDIERDTEDIVTRLWAFGREDMPVTSVNGGKAYIESGNISKYGVHEGYRDYSDYTDPYKILAHAGWEFDTDNPDRIDIPKLSISGKLIDLAKLAEYGDTKSIELGDTVHVIDADGTEYTERVIEGVWHPFDAEETTVSLGHVKRDMFYSIYQLSGVKRAFEAVSTVSGKILSRSISGILNSSRNKLQSGNGLLEIDGDLLTIYDDSGRRRKRLELGNAGGEFALNIYNIINGSERIKVKLGDTGDDYALAFYDDYGKIRLTIGEKDGGYAFAIYDNKGNAAVYMDSDGEVYFSGTLKTSGDAKIGTNLSVGNGGNAVINFEGPAVTEGQISVVDKAMIIQANESVDIRADMVTVNGKEVAPADTAARMQGDIDAMENSIIRLAERVRDLENKAEG